MSREFESKYFDVGAYYESTMKSLGWTKEEFISALEILENLPLEKLKEIFEGKFGIKFSPAYQLNEEDYLNLIDEVDKEELLELLYEISKH